MPLEIQRYFTPPRLERSRGVVAALSAATGKPGQVRAEDLEQFAKILDFSIAQIAPKYSKGWKGDWEAIISSIYRDALIHLLDKPDRLPENLRSLLVQARKTR